LIRDRQDRDGGVRSAQAGGFCRGAFSEATDELSLTLYYGEHRRRYYRDKAFENDLKWLEGKFPGKEVSIASDTRDEQDLADRRQ